MDTRVCELTAKEVLLFDSSTFIKEAGLTSRGASALRHYLYVRGTQLAVPQVVAEECERHLSNFATGKVKSVHAALGSLARFCGAVKGWTPPQDVDIAERVKAVARGEAFGAVVIEETSALRRRAEQRHRAERPPSHSKNSPKDCRIWEQCLDLLRGHDVIFVSRDKDFRGRRQPQELHPQLRAEADAVPGGRLTFHPGMDSLLSDLSTEVPQLPTEQVLAFIYDAIAEEARELEANSGCRPSSGGTVEQQFYTTDRADVVEVRLKVNDRWKHGDSEETLEFRLAGSCRYRLSDSELCDLSVTNLGLYMTQPDGTERAVKGSYVNLSMHAYAGAPPVRPEPVRIGVTTELG